MSGISGGRVYIKEECVRAQGEGIKSHCKASVLFV